MKTISLKAPGFCVNSRLNWHTRILLSQWTLLLPLHWLPNEVQHLRQSWRILTIRKLFTLSHNLSTWMSLQAEWMSCWLKRTVHSLHVLPDWFFHTEHASFPSLPGHCHVLWLHQWPAAGFQTTLFCPTESMTLLQNARDACCDSPSEECHRSLQDYETCQLSHSALRTPWTCDSTFFPALGPTKTWSHH